MDERLNPQQWTRPPRVRPRLPEGEVRLPSPPAESNDPRRGWSALVAPLLIAGVMVLATLLIGSASGRSLLFVIPMAATAVATAVVGAVQFRGERRRRERMEAEKEAAYQATLERAHRELRSYMLEQQRVRCYLDPEPEQLLRIAAGGPAAVPGRPEPRLWERRPGDADFLALRVGLGSRPSTIKLIANNPAAGEAVELLDRYCEVPDVPLTIDLCEAGSIGVAGPAPRRHALAVALLWNIVVHHAPADVRIAAVLDTDHDGWSWMRWLPHCAPLNGDTQRRMLATAEAPEELWALLLDELGRRRERVHETGGRPVLPTPRLVVLVGAASARHPAVSELVRYGRQVGVYALVAAERWDEIPGSAGATVDLCNQPRMAVAGEPWTAIPLVDVADKRHGEQLGRSLARIGGADGAQTELPRSVRLLDLLGIADAAELEQPAWWARVPDGAWHAEVPIGLAAGSEPVFLDLREHHHGPHGIIAGATGAGKSELLQAILAALAITHAPDRAQFLLIDFKGGATLRIFEHLPHTVGLVTDLHGRLAERAITAIKSEIRRRKELLNAAEAKDIAAYRALGDSVATLANLLIVIDEFDEMVKEQPDFVAELVRVVKQGRSLGVHLLLATQQPSRAVKDEIKTQLQYWIALRLGSSEDSREMLQRPDAFFLPAEIPGRAWIRLGAGSKLFQAPRVGGQYRPRASAEVPALLALDELGRACSLEPARPVPAVEDPGAAQLSDLHVIVERLCAAGEPYAAARSAIWRPPLAKRLLLSDVLGADALAGGEQCWRQPLDGEWLRLPIGLLDVPQESRQEPLLLDLQAGHVLIAGGPGSGKTVLLRTLLLALALTHSPADAWCYVLDAGGQGLSALRTMPHLGGLVQVRDVERVRRVVWMFGRELARRQELFRNAGAADLPSYRRETGERLPAMVLLIDKFALFREEHEALIDELIALARAGRAYGIHLVVTLDRPSDMTYRLSGLFETRLVLRLPDEGDAITLTSKRSAAGIPLEQPGRGYRQYAEHGWLEFQTALPYLEAGAVCVEDAASLLDAEVGAGLKTRMQLLQRCWQALPEAVRHTAPRVRLLPESLSLAQLWAQAAPGKAENALDAAIGIESQTLEPASLRFGPAMPGLLVFGGPRSGKTTTLSTMLLSLARVAPPEQLEIVLVDPRGGLRELQQLPHVTQHAQTEADVAALVPALDTAFATAGPRRVICVDDYELCASLMSGQFGRPLVSIGGRSFAMLLESVATLGRDRGWILLLAGNMTVPPAGFMTQLAAARNGVIMRPHEFPPASSLLGVRLPLASPGGAPPAGRGLLVLDGMPRWLQVALPDARDIETTKEQAVEH